MIKYFLIFLMFTFYSCQLFKNKGKIVYLYSDEEREFRIQEIDSVFETFDDVVVYKKIDSIIVNVWNEKVELKTLNNHRLFQLFPKDTYHRL